MVFSQDRRATLELFNHTLVQKHAQVVSIELMSQQDPPRLGFYNYNFFGPSIDNDLAMLNSVWHFGDMVINLDTLFADLTTFRGHHMESRIIFLPTIQRG